MSTRTFAATPMHPMPAATGIGLRALAGAAIREIHLAGFTRKGNLPTPLWTARLRIYRNSCTLAHIDALFDPAAAVPPVCRNQHNRAAYARSA